MPAILPYITLTLLAAFIGLCIANANQGLRRGIKK